MNVDKVQVIIHGIDVDALGVVSFLEFVYVDFFHVFLVVVTQAEFFGEANDKLY